MADALIENRSANSTRVNVNDAADVRRWAIYFGISEVQLKTVVQAVGPMVPDVRKEIEGTP